MSKTAQISPMSHKFCFLQLQITNPASTEICGAEIFVHSVYGAWGGCWSEIDWSHSQSEERGFCPTANQMTVDSAHAKLTAADNDMANFQARLYFNNIYK